MKTLKDINWNQVYTFYEVARKMSMKEAANILGVSTATVSEQIKRLEKLVGLKLFHRETRRIVLTDEGASLFVCAREMFEVGGRFLDTVSPDSIGGYAVRVGIQETQSEAVAVNFVNQYWDLFAPFGTVNTFREPAIENLIEKLLQGRCDWGISTSIPKSNRLTHQTIATSNFIFCCSNRIFYKFKKKEDILSNIPFARGSWDHQLNDAVDDAFRVSNIYPDEIIESDHDQFILELAQRGRCVAILPEVALSSLSSDSELCSFALGTPISLNLYAIWPKGNQKMISIKKLIELLNLSGEPATMDDPDLQIKVSEVSDHLLKKS